MGALIFAPAGDIRYWRGWLFLAVFVGASILMTLDMAARDPALLARRMKGGPTAEKSPTQKFIMLFTSLGFVALLVLAAVRLPPRLGADLGRRRDFRRRPGRPRPLRKRPRLSRKQLRGGDDRLGGRAAGSSRPAPTQSSAIRCMRAPSSTSSACRWRSLLVGTRAAGAHVPVPIWRLLDEERFLAVNLDGYREYMAKVRWRLGPGLF